ncbi:MAG TPA: 2-C-methyl-D-erythritol 2,4-cyclodiphosphate synthase [Spongiibacteraceae bacterium]|nr:2-C-methyl-D-erythritol 2,4-cyclodiphosphate synthase [Spongiibacteraceae bacterium]
MTIRIGHGYDVHRFGPGDFVTLGGVRIAHTHGVVAHSDGDVLLHALCDALLGAAALGDIGQHFPDSDPQYRGIDSRKLLRHVYALIKQNHYVLGNADMTLIAQAPRVMKYAHAMRENIAADLECSIGQINIKATTTEEMGFVGREEGLAAYAVVLLEKRG